MKPLFLSLCFISATFASLAQIDTTQYPAERQQIRNLLYKFVPGSDKSCSDFIAVGPKGDISFSRQEWIAAQVKMKATFKSVQVVPGSDVIRVYEGATAVVNFLAAVSLVVDGKDVTLKVRRLEVYHKTTTGWCMVAGQGTEVDEKLFPVNK